jgi:hypothetical protein
LENNQWNSFASLEWFEEIFGKISSQSTFITQTTNGGFHVYFKYTDKIKNKSNVCKNVDVLSNGSCCYEGRFYPVFLECSIRELTDLEINQLNVKKNDTGNLKKMFMTKILLLCHTFYKMNFLNLFINVLLDI